APSPPCSSGTCSPSQPSPATSFHVAGTGSSGASSSDLAAARCPARNERATSASARWSSVIGRGMALLLPGPDGGALLGEREGAFAGVGRGHDRSHDLLLPRPALVSGPVAAVAHDLLGGPHGERPALGDLAGQLERAR